MTSFCVKHVTKNDIFYAGEVSEKGTYFAYLPIEHIMCPDLQTTPKEASKGCLSIGALVAFNGCACVILHLRVAHHSEFYSGSSVGSST